MRELTPRLLTALRLRIHSLNRQLRELETNLMKPKIMRKGSVRIMHLRCGKKQCICKRKRKPQKHGPYTYRRVMVKGKQKSVYIKDKKIIEQLRNYKKYNEYLSQYRKIVKKVSDVFEKIKEMHIVHDVK